MKSSSWIGCVHSSYSSKGKRVGYFLKTVKLVMFIGRRCVFEIFFYYAVINNSGKNGKKVVWDCKLLGTLPVLLSSIYKLWGEKKARHNNNLYGILEKETSDWGKLCFLYYKASKGSESERTWIFFLFCLFLCFSLWAICKWTSLNWFNQSIGICNSMLSAVRDSKRLSSTKKYSVKLGCIRGRLNWSFLCIYLFFLV